MTDKVKTIIADQLGVNVNDITMIWALIRLIW